MMRPGEMNSSKAVGTDATQTDVSLIRGGPFYRAQEVTRLIAPKRWNLGRRTLLAIAIAWLPLFILTLLSNPASLTGLLTDYSVNIRILVALPLLLIGQVLMETTVRTMVRQIHAADLLAPGEQPKLDKILATLIRLRDSFIPEILLVVLIYVHVSFMVGSLAGIARPWTMTGSGASVHLSNAGWYYALVSQLSYQFLLGLSLWKWLLWTIFLLRLSKLNLQLVATHPDQHGGVGFLGMSPRAFAPTAFTAAAAIGGTWRAQILRTGAHWMNFKIEGIVLLLIVLLIAVGPLALFVPRLAALRRRGVLDYGVLGQKHSMEFQKKWVLDAGEQTEDFLTAPEISTLTDYAASYENVEKLKPFPVDKGSLIGLTAVVALALLPVVLAEVPFATVLKSLFEAVK